jgi:flagellin
MQSINTNLASLNAQRHMSKTQNGLATSMERLSSGLRVNSAKDDAAGLAIADRMNAQVKGMNVAIRNANDGISMAQTAEGGLATATDILQRMRELAVQASNGTNSSGDLNNLGSEFVQLQSEINRLSSATKFNGKAVIGGDATTFTFQIGANNGETVNIVSTNLVSAGSAAGSAASVSTTAISNQASAQAAITQLDSALNEVSTQRANLGASINRFQFTIQNLQTAAENQSAARGRIMDADYAVETANLSRSQILQQAGNAMIAQANQAPQQIMSLLKG